MLMLELKVPVVIREVRGISSPRVYIYGMQFGRNSNKSTKVSDIRESVYIQNHLQGYMIRGRLTGTVGHALSTTLPSTYTPTQGQRGRG